uniref:Putative structural protein n=1 Tax=viral metagenome TaxID=1070528 RepID=A0A6M3IMP6_9ZZZZ
MGFEKPVANDTYGHYEENHIHEVIHSKEIVTQPAIGANIQFTLDAVDLDANNNFYVRRWDVLQFNNEVMGSVILINVTVPAAPVVTVSPSEVTDQFPGLVAGEEIIIATSAFSEGSGQPEGAVSGTWEYSNTAQIIKETIGYTGTEMVNQLWFDVTSKGQSIPAYYFKGQIDIDYRMALKIDGALLWGKETTNVIIDPDTGRPIKTTEGLIPYIRRVGNEQTCGAGVFDVDEFDAMDNTLDREFAGNYILGLLGIALHQDIENGLVAYFANTNITYAKQATNGVLFNSNEALSASVNFTYLTKSERTFLMKRMGVFNNRKLYGADGYNAPRMGVWMPINRRKDPVSGNMVDSVGTRYRALGKYSRRMEVWQVGGAGEGLKVTEFDKRNTYQRCHVGAHFRGGNQFVLMET